MQERRFAIKKAFRNDKGLLGKKILYIGINEEDKRYITVIVRI